MGTIYLTRAEGLKRGLKEVQPAGAPESPPSDGPAIDGKPAGSSMTLGTDSHENSLGRMGRQWVARGMGAADSLSMGFADEASGAMNAIGGAASGDLEHLKENYIKGRDKYRDTTAGVKKWSSADDPLVGPYAQGQVMGQVPMMMAPGPKALEALNGLKGLMGVGKRVAASGAMGAGYGAMYGTGSSEGKTPEAVAEDAKTGAKWGGALGVLGGAGSEALRGARGVVSSAMPSAEAKLAEKLGSVPYRPPSEAPMAPPVEAPPLVPTKQIPALRDQPAMSQPAMKPPPPVPDAVPPGPSRQRGFVESPLVPIPARRARPGPWSSQGDPLPPEAPRVETPSTEASTGAQSPRAKQEALIAALKEKVNGSPRDSMKTGEIQVPEQEPPLMAHGATTGEIRSAYNQAGPSTNLNLPGQTSGNTALMERGTTVNAMRPLRPDEAGTALIPRQQAPVVELPEGSIVGPRGAPTVYTRTAINPRQAAMPVDPMSIPPGEATGQIPRPQSVPPQAPPPPPPAPAQAMPPRPAGPVPQMPPRPPVPAPRPQPPAPLPDHTPGLRPDLTSAINQAGKGIRGPVAGAAVKGAVGGGLLGVGGGGAAVMGYRKLAQLAQTNPAVKAYLLRRLAGLAGGAQTAAQAAPILGVGAMNR